MYNKMSALYFLTFSYALFTLTVFIPDKQADVYSWLWRICFKSIIYIIYCILLKNNSNLKPLSSNIIAIYIVFLIAKQIIAITHYMNIYHSSTVPTYVISLMLILIFVASKNTLIYRMAYPLASMTILLLAILFVLNVDKINPYNLYSIQTEKTYNITLFDYAVPMLIILNKSNYNLRKSGVSIVLTVSLINIVLTILCFSAFSGNLLYSISPLQAVFQISGTSLIRNFDALYSFLILFAYFSAILMLLWAYDILSENNPKIKYGFLFLIIPFLLFVEYTAEYLLFIEMTIIGILYFGRAKYEKT